MIVLHLSFIIYYILIQANGWVIEDNLTYVDDEVLVFGENHDRDGNDNSDKNNINYSLEQPPSVGKVSIRKIENN